MRTLQLILISFLILLLSTWVAVAYQPEPDSRGRSPLASETEILRAEFGLFNPPESGDPLFVPTNTVPLVEHQGYGWVINLRTNKSRVRWREEFTLPAAPVTWSAGDIPGDQKISPDRKVSVIDREVEPENGMIYNSWSVAPGDPKGRYVIRVIIEDTLERVFVFEVK
jgi:hypothetical protein